MEEQMKQSEETILEVKDLSVFFSVHKKWLAAVDGVSFSVAPGEITGIVGESGSGKSVMSQSILRLRDHDTVVKYNGEILFEREDLLKKSLSDMQEIRGNQISIIFQDPLNSLSPVHTIGEQLSEILMLHKKMGKQEAGKRAVQMLELTGIPGAEACMKKYPFELSGGMQQRVMIAMALACEPKLLIADEPTTALDVTIQEQILYLIQELNEKLGMSVLFITHDMGVVSQICHSVKVMYLGQIVEEAKTDRLFAEPSSIYKGAGKYSAFVEKRENFRQFRERRLPLRKFRKDATSHAMFGSNETVQKEQPPSVEVQPTFCKMLEIRRETRTEGEYRMKNVCWKSAD